MAKKSVVIRKLKSTALVGLSSRGLVHGPAQYGVFKDGGQVGVIQAVGDPRYYRAGATAWSVLDIKGKRLGRFYGEAARGGGWGGKSPRVGPFHQARKFALMHKW